LSIFLEFAKVFVQILFSTSVFRCNVMLWLFKNVPRGLNSSISPRVSLQFKSFFLSVRLSVFPSFCLTVFMFYCCFNLPFLFFLRKCGSFLSVLFYKVKQMIWKSFGQLPSKSMSMTQNRRTDWLHRPSTVMHRLTKTLKKTLLN